jgi:hypothetical protein
LRKRKGIRKRVAAVAPPEVVMAVIKIPRTPPEAYNPNRPVSALLKMQVFHLREAEKLFPPKHRSDIYINGIKTEAAASEYIGYVTAKIRQLHKEAARPRVVRIPTRIPEIAAAGAARAGKSKTSSRAKASAKRTAKPEKKTQKKK